MNTELLRLATLQITSGMCCYLDIGPYQGQNPSFCLVDAKTLKTLLQFVARDTRCKEWTVQNDRGVIGTLEQTSAENRWILVTSPLRSARPLDQKLETPIEAILAWSRELIRTGDV